eukprot:s602_g10.t1
MPLTHTTSLLFAGAQPGRHHARGVGGAAPRLAARERGGYRDRIEQAIALTWTMAGVDWLESLQCSW